MEADLQSQESIDFIRRNIVSFDVDENLSSDDEQEDQIQLLLQKSKKFVIGGIEHEFDDQEAIFFISEAQSKTKKIKKCRCCKFVFTDSKQMTFCTFCGYSADSACSKKTRIYPGSEPDPETGKQTQRGTICKLCDRKFFIREMISATTDSIKTQNISLSAISKTVKSTKRELKEMMKEQEEEEQTIKVQIAQLRKDIIKHHENSEVVQKKIDKKAQQNEELNQKRQELEQSVNEYQQKKKQVVDETIEMTEMVNQIKKTLNVDFQAQKKSSDAYRADSHMSKASGEQIEIPDDVSDLQVGGRGYRSNSATSAERDEIESLGTMRMLKGSVPQGMDADGPQLAGGKKVKKDESGNVTGKGFCGTGQDQACCILF